MNWEEIRQKYPKAFGLLMNSYQAKQMDMLNNAGKTMYYIIDRALYDFFDEKGLIISIIFQMAKNDYAYEIGDKDEIFFIMPIGYNLRTYAEQKAFTKAFEILEERLK